MALGPSSPAGLFLGSFFLIYTQPNQHTAAARQQKSSMVQARADGKEQQNRLASGMEETLIPVSSH